MSFQLWRKRLPLVAESDCEPELGLAPDRGHAHGLAKEQAAGAHPGPAYSRTPATAVPFVALLRLLERIGDALLGPRFNPVYRSGTLAVLLLTLATATGVVLVFFYRVSDPFGSVAHLQDQVWLGRWLRSWHRYLSDACVVATALHLLRMVAEGKVWGPRALAWISGLALLGMVFFTAWTGFVMVWDMQALRLAQAGARVADLLPIFSEPISRAFSGATVPAPSFFFMNLFLHVALPLGLVILLWLHTSRLARSAWFPERRELWAWGGAALLASLLWPVALGVKADALQLGGVYPLDLYYNAWLPAALAIAPAWGVLAAALLGLLLVSMPWWWRPAPETRPAPSHNDEARCQGCVTCANDCPFEAIAMVPRTQGQGSLLVAKVDPLLCVSCGLCVASCDRLSIGPFDRIGTKQMAEAQAMTRQEDAVDKVVLIHCRQSPLGPDLLKRVAETGHGAVPWPMDCVGDLHPFAVHALQQRFVGVFVLSCHTAACQMREGASLARRRLLEGYEPSGKVALESARLRLVQPAADGLTETWWSWQEFRFRLGAGRDPGALPSASVRRGLLNLAAGTALVALLALAAAFQVGLPRADTVLRLGWRLPGQAVRTCRDLSEQEYAALPAHMRRKQTCTTRRLSYRLRLQLDGLVLPEREVHPQGVHGDSPLNVSQELALGPGAHTLQVDFEPMDDPQGQGRRLGWTGTVKAEPGRAVLLTLNRDGQALALLAESR